MNNQGPPQALLDRYRNNGTLEQKATPSNIGTAPQQNAQPAASRPIKRKASDTLSSQTSKSGRNLSWNGFRNTDVHILCSDDEDDLFSATRSSQNEPSASRFLPESHFGQSQEEHAISYGIIGTECKSLRNPQSLPLSQYPSNEKHGRSREALVATQKIENTKPKFSFANQAATIPKSIPQGTNKREQILSAERYACSSGREFMDSKARSEQLKGSMCSPIIIDDDDQERKNKAAFVKATDELHNSSRARLGESSRPQEQVVSVGQGNETKSFVSSPPRSLLPDNPKHPLDLSGYQADIHSPNDLMSAKTRMKIQHRQTSSGHPFSKATPNLLGLSHQEDDLQKAMRAKTSKQSTPALPVLPARIPFSSTRSIFVNDKERQRLTYGVESKRSDQKTEVNQRQDFDRGGVHDRTLSLGNHKRNETPILASSNGLKVSNSCTPDQSESHATLYMPNNTQDNNGNIERPEIHFSKHTTGIKQSSLVETPFTVSKASEATSRSAVTHNLSANNFLARCNELDGQTFLEPRQQNGITRTTTSMPTSSVNGRLKSSETLNHANRDGTAQKSPSLFVKDSERPKFCSAVEGVQIPPVSCEGQRKMKAELQRGLDTVKAMKQKVAVLRQLNIEKEARKAKENEEILPKLNDKLNKNNTETPNSTRRSDLEAPSDTQRISKKAEYMKKPERHQKSLDRLGEGFATGAPSPSHVHGTVREGQSNNMGWIGISEAGSLIDKSHSKRNGQQNRIHARDEPSTRREPEDERVSHSSFGSINPRPGLTKPKRDYTAVAIDLDKITDDDWLLMQLHRKGWKMKDIHSRWNDLTGSTKAASSLQKRLIRLRNTFPENFPRNDHPKSQPQIAEDIKTRNLCILQQIRDGAEHEALFVNGHNSTYNDDSQQLRDARCEKRKLALSGGPPDNTATLRSKSGGKHISEDLAKYIIGNLERGDEDLLDSEDDDENLSIRNVSPEADDDNIHFAYQVRRRTTLDQQPEEEDEWYVCGDVYSSITDVNNAAIAEAQVNRGIDIWPLTKWESEISEETGLIGLRGTGVNGTVEIRVHRFLRSYHDAIPPKSKAGWVKRQVFDVYEIRTTFEESIDWGDDIIDQKEQDLEELLAEQSNCTDACVRTSSLQSRATDIKTADGLVGCSSNTTDNVCMKEAKLINGDAEQDVYRTSLMTVETADEDDYLFVEGADINPQLFDGSLAPAPQAPPSKVIIRTITRTKLITKKISTTEKPVGAISAIRDSANRLAGKTFRKLQMEFDPPARKYLAYDKFFKAVKEADEEMSERLDKMEEKDESFDDMLQTESSQEGHGDDNHRNATVRVRVEERILENPRNF